MTEVLLEFATVTNEDDRLLCKDCEEEFVKAYPDEPLGRRHVNGQTDMCSSCHDRLPMSEISSYRT